MSIANQTFFKLTNCSWRWHYDARNTEALAAQVALAAWRPLYGVHFELVSHHASLRHLFHQKAPSARILRLCEFLADFDFQEIMVVKGTDNVVPDFLSSWRNFIGETKQQQFTPGLFNTVQKPLASSKFKYM
jgi:hypothetical protein